MATYNADVEVWLSDDFRLTSMGYVDHAPYRRAIRVTIAGETEQAVLNTAWAIFNSYPEEMHAPVSYLSAVKRYRDSRNRSLSVGDVVVVDGTAYAVASFGFDKVEGWQQ